MSIYAFHSQNKPSGGAEFDITLEFKHTFDNLTTIGGLPFKPTIGLLALCCNSEDPGFMGNGNPKKRTTLVVFNQFIGSGEDCFLTLEPGTTVFRKQLKWSEVAQGFKNMYRLNSTPVLYDFTDWNGFFTEDYSKVTKFAMSLRPFIICHQSEASFYGANKRGICKKPNTSKYVYFSTGQFTTEYKYSNYMVSNKEYSTSKNIPIGSVYNGPGYDLISSDLYSNVRRAADIFSIDRGYSSNSSDVGPLIRHIYFGSVIGNYDHKELFPTFEIDLNKCKNWDDLNLRLNYKFSMKLNSTIEVQSF